MRHDPLLSPVSFGDLMSSIGRIAKDEGAGVVLKMPSGPPKSVESDADTDGENDGASVVMKVPLPSVESVELDADADAEAFDVARRESHEDASDRV